MKLRLVSRVMVVSLVVILAAVMLIRSRLDQSQAAPALQGTNLGGTPAPAFTLTDQSGSTVSLASLKGHPVVLVFIFTHCPAGCPYAELLHATTLKLGPQASRVSWIAVSVDPAGDTPAGANAFIAQHHLTGYLRYLLGTQVQLAPLWHAYGIVPGGNVADEPPGAMVDQGRGVYVLDGQGRERIFLGYPFDPSVLSADLRALLTE